MKKILLPLMLGSFALPAVAMDYQTDDGFNLPELSADVFDAYNMEANANNRNNNRNKNNRNNSRPARQAPLRTRMFIGMEHTETRFDERGKNQNTNFLIDGTTTFNEKFRVSYVVNERSITYRDGDTDNNRGKRLNVTINPRYDHFVSPAFSWFLAFPTRRSLDVNGSQFEEQAYTVKPGFNFRNGPHTFNITGHVRYIENENHQNNNVGRNYIKSYNFNPTYIYRLNRTTNVSVELGITENDNNLDTWNRNIKPSVSHRWSNGIRSSFHVNFGKNGDKNKRGERFTNWGLNNNMPLNRNFDLVANLGWRTGSQYHERDPYPNPTGDRETLFFKFGFNVKF